MKLLFLHGAPAVGKLTVARAVLRAVPGRLFDNHAPIDLARTVFEFGAPGFWDLVHDAQLLVLRAAAAAGVPLLVTTFCYAEPDDRELFEAFERVVHRAGGAVLPVFLRCTDEEAARRVGNEDRVERRKLTSPEALAAFRAAHALTPVPREDCLVLDTDAVSPDDTAGRIIQHFSLSARDVGAAGFRPARPGRSAG